MDKPLLPDALRERIGPRELDADRGFDSDSVRRRLRRRGIRLRIARCGEPHGSGQGKFRWVGERTRKDRSSAIHQAFLAQGVAIICLNQLIQSQFC